MQNDQTSKQLWSSLPNPANEFGNLEFEAPGSITYVVDEKLNKLAVRLWKPSHASSYRCECRNIRVNGSAYKWLAGKTYHIKWKSKITKINGGYGDFVIFQWKSYPNGKQNYPLLMTAVNDEVRLIHCDASGKWTTLWVRKTKDNEWVDYDINLHLSDDESAGWLEFKCNGEPQNLAGVLRFHGRTLDGSNEPKWGVYNRDQPAHEIEQLVADISVSVLA